MAGPFDIAKGLTLGIFGRKKSKKGFSATSRKKPLRKKMRNYTQRGVRQTTSEEKKKMREHKTIDKILRERRKKSK